MTLLFLFMESVLVQHIVHTHDSISFTSILASRSHPRWHFVHADSSKPFTSTLALRSHRLDVNDMTVNEATIKNETDSARIALFGFSIPAIASDPLAVGDAGFI